MNNDLNLQSYVFNRCKDTVFLSSGNTSNNEDYNRPISIIRLIIPSILLKTPKTVISNNKLKNNQAPDVIKFGCTCLALKVCGKTLGEIVNPILNRSFRSEERRVGK